MPRRVKVDFITSNREIIVARYRYVKAKTIILHSHWLNGMGRAECSVARSLNCTVQAGHAVDKRARARKLEDSSTTEISCFLSAGREPD